MAFKPTYEMYELAQKISDGDVLSIAPLWELMFERPLDRTRPIDDIGNEIVAKFTEYNEAVAAEKAAEAQRATAEDMRVMFQKSWGILETLFGAGSTTK